MKAEFIAWLKASWKGILVGGICGALMFGSIGMGCGYVKGCSAQKEKQANVK